MLPRDAISKDDFDAMERGLPVYRKPVTPRPEPEPPIVENQIRFEDISEGGIIDISARGRSLKNAVRNAEGQIFTGYDVLVVVGEKTFSGWMNEKDFLLLKKRVPGDRIDLLRKISF
jgi:hypothetical protein